MSGPESTNGMGRRGALLIQTIAAGIERIDAAGPGNSPDPTMNAVDLRRLRIFGQRDKLKADRSRGGVRGGRKAEAAQRRVQSLPRRRPGARVAMAALSGEKTLAELSAEFGVHPTMISNWKQELVKRAGELFGRGSKAPAAADAQKVIDDLHRKIGQLQVECDFLAGQPAISRLLRGGR